MEDRSTVEPNDSAVPLVVDLDGTLSTDDSFVLVLMMMALRRPITLALAILRLPMTGWAQFKMHVFGRSGVGAGVLLFNEQLVAWLRTQSETGRECWLVTASPQGFAEDVGRRLPLFARIVGTENRNLKGERKVEWLNRTLGPSGFDYVGDAVADRVVWRSARKCFGCGRVSTLAAHSRAGIRFERTFVVARPPAIVAIMRALRPHQWTKNFLVGVPLVTAHLWASGAAWWHTTLAFFAFSAVASSIYLINDCLDIEHDRAHKRKRSRPFAAGDLNPLWAPVLVTALIGGAFFVSWFYVPSLFGVLGVYWVLSFTYALLLKRKVMLDVVALTLLYLIRIFGGAVAVDVNVSVWLMGFAGFLMASLALAKRTSEVINLPEGRGGAAGRAYVRGDLTVLMILGVSTALLAQLVFAMYIGSPAVMLLYANPQRLWLALPFQFYWAAHMWIAVGRGMNVEDPILFLVRSRSTYIAASGVLAAIALSL